MRVVQFAELKSIKKRLKYTVIIGKTWPDGGERNVVLNRNRVRWQCRVGLDMGDGSACNGHQEHLLLWDTRRKENNKCNPLFQVSQATDRQLARQSKARSRLRYDDARPYRSTSIISWIELRNIPGWLRFTYSPVLSPSDFGIFIVLKE